MKRIISLILVLATAFLMLTGCAFRYDKKDMSKYAEFDANAFKNALQNLSITLGDFIADPTVRDPKVNDSVAQALLKATEATKKFGGSALGKYDSVYFCYYAEDSEGNIFFANKLDVTKLTNIQLGLSTLDGLNKAFADALLGQDIQNYIYTTSGTNYVKSGDVVSVSYFASWDDDNNAETPDKTEVVWNEYCEVDPAIPFAEKLLINQAQVGVEIPFQFDVTVNEGGVDIVKHYSNVKVESIVKEGAERTDKVADDDIVCVSYVMSFKAEKFLNTETNTYEIPAPYNAMDYKIVGENVQITVSYEFLQVDEAPMGTVPSEKTFEQQLIGKAAGSTTNSIKETGAITVGEDKIDIEYTNVKINWINGNNNGAIQFTYTPYPDAYVEADKNEKTEKNTYGKAITLNEVALTYYILPVYYIDVVDFTDAADAEATAKLILTELYSTVASTQTKEHEHTDDDHEHETEYVFDTLNNTNIKNGDKTLATLVTELSTLATTLKDKRTALSTALSALTTAQKNLASTSYAKDTDEYNTLKTNRDNAETNYTTSKTAEQAALAEVTAKVKEILACTGSENGVAAGLVADYKNYQYDTLDTAFRTDIKDKLAAEIIKVLKSSVTFNDNLPKKAVKEAYKSIMDSYQYDFYEGKYSATGSSSSTSTSTSTETNYSHYQGSFKTYLIDKVLGGSGTMKEAKAAVQAQAEAAVKEVMYIYIFNQMVESAWGTELSLTKEEKENIEINLAYQAYQIQMYYGVNYEYDIESAYNGSQFDKVMEFLLTTTETKNDKNVDVDAFTNIGYTAK